MGAVVLVSAFAVHLAGWETSSGVQMPPEMVAVDAGAAGLDVRDQLLLLDGEPFAGRLLQRFEDGTLRRSTSYRGGLPTGDDIEWAPNGRVLSWETHTPVCNVAR